MIFPKTTMQYVPSLSFITFTRQRHEISNSFIFFSKRVEATESNFILPNIYLDR